MNESSHHRQHHSRSLRSVDTKMSLNLDSKWQCSHSSLLQNQEQSAKASENGRGDKSIGNTQSQQFAVEQSTLMSFERRRTPAQSERQQAIGRAQNQTAGKHRSYDSASLALPSFLAHARGHRTVGLHGEGGVFE